MNAPAVGKRRQSHTSAARVSPLRWVIVAWPTAQIAVTGRSAWSDRAAGLRGPLAVGPNAWRTTYLPR